MPVLNSEVAYEEIMGSNWEDVQWLMFWSCMLSGAAGHTYGANGIWQVNTEAQPFGLSPRDQSWGGLPWDEACRLPGSRQLALGKRLLERYSWWRFKPHPEWIESHWHQDDYYLAYVAGVPGEVRVAYLSHRNFGTFFPTNPELATGPSLKVKGLEGGTDYRAFYVDPRSGDEQSLGEVSADQGGEWQPPASPPPSRTGGWCWKPADSARYQPEETPVAEPNAPSSLSGGVSTGPSITYPFLSLVYSPHRVQGC